MFFSKPHRRLGKSTCAQQPTNVIYIYLTIILVVSCVSSCSDTVSSRYTSYQDAKDQKLFEKGWLPDILPTNTTQIKTNNDLDLNTSKGSFIIPTDDLLGFTNQLIKMQKGIYTYSHDGKHKWLFDVNNNTGHVKYKLVRRYD